MAGHHGAHTVDTASLVASHQVDGRDQSQLHTIRTCGSLGQGGVVSESVGGIGVGNNWLGNNSRFRVIGLLGDFLVEDFLVNVWEGLDFLMYVGLRNILKLKF